MIVLTGHGALAEAYAKVNRACYIHSFRSLADNEIADIISRTDILIHNAATLINKDAEQNLALTKRIVYLILKHKPEVKFLYIGSMSYLIRGGYLSIDCMSPYAYSKFIGETYCMATLSHLKIVRFSSIFYRNPERDGLSRLISDAVNNREITLINSGYDKRDWISINVAGRELNRIIKNEEKPIITVASGIETTFVKIAKIIAKYTECKINFKTEKYREVLSKFEKTTDMDLEDEIKMYINQLKTKNHEKK